MLQRLMNLRRKMNNQNIDSVFIFEPSNRRYLSGFTGSTGYLFITRDKEYFLTDFRYIAQAKKQTNFEVIEIKDSLSQFLKTVVEEEKINNMGIEEEYVTYSWYQNLSQKVDISLIKVDDILRDLRIIKDNEEINNIKQAVAISQKSFSDILEFIKPGVTESEIALQLDYSFRKNGAQSNSFDTIVASGINSALPHAEPTDKRIQYGDFIVIDSGCKYNGYCSDMTRTVVVGNPSDEQRKIYNIVLESQKRALEYINALVSGKDVDKVSRDYISINGYGENFGHSLGHGVGLDIHELPTLSPKSETLLMPGMVVTVEPGIYIENFGGVRIEDMVIIKDNGMENLMSLTKELIVL